MQLISALFITSLTLLAQTAAAQTRIFCCDESSGKKVCGDFLPQGCQGRAYEERDQRGYVSKIVEAPLTAEQQARRDAENLRKAEEEKKAAEERRRNLALLATYSSEKDIAAARDRALGEVEKNMKQAQLRLDEANKKKRKLENDKEFFKGKAIPDDVKAQVRDNEKEIAAQTAAVLQKAKEGDEIRAKFAAERARYLELTGKRPADTGGTGAAKAVLTPDDASVKRPVVDNPRSSPGQQVSVQRSSAVTNTKDSK